ncbi:MAG: hypothetical protein J5I93_28475 [Pirellulaceae bacterium]|nr:hypothetical protein [Pirellulaceae bacterium]
MHRFWKTPETPRFGVIEAADGRLLRIGTRLWPKRVSYPEVAWDRWLVHGRRAGDRCRLYYNQPWGSPDYLAVTYLVSYRTTTLSTLRAALAALDQIAELKGVHAIVCQATCRRLSDRALRRAGWEQHLDPRGRHYIKRLGSRR